MERHFTPLIKLVFLVNLLSVNSAYSQLESVQSVSLYQRPGFFHATFDSISMPNDIENMGLMGIGYFGELNDYGYVGIEGFGSLTGSQGGLFVLGFAGGAHYQFWPRWWLNADLFLGGGGGRSSLVGGGLMLRPSLGLSYDLGMARLGLHYSYVNFTSGLIHSNQIGLDLDIPFDFYYTHFEHLGCLIHSTNILVEACQRILCLDRNDFAVIVQSYFQKSGTKNVLNETQDGTIQLVGAEFDHYLSQQIFWWLKTSGAYHGIPNGYMDVLGGIGYHRSLLGSAAFVAQFGVGGGGGGNVDTGGGFLIHPSLGFELALNQDFALRLNAGYLWAPKGNFKAATTTLLLLYHLDTTHAESGVLKVSTWLGVQGWRLNLSNQTYIRPQRSHWNELSPIELITFQIDQSITPHFFFIYQAAAAYSGNHSGGYATGMVGPGIQTSPYFNNKLQFYASVLIGAGGGGSLALAGGAIIEPVLGVHYYLDESFGITASVSQLKALRDNLNTTMVSLGLTVRFATLNRVG